MKRETSNVVRFVFEEFLPPILRDSGLFRWAAHLVWGPHIDELARFRKRAALLTACEYEALYRQHPRVHDSTDNSELCVRRIEADISGRSVLDAGCGTGFLLRAIAATNPDLTRLVGLDFVRPCGLDTNGIEFVLGPIEHLPFEDDAFDTVICTHVIEHILDYHAAIAELRRVAAKRLIIVVPCEREALYSFNPHLNFFPYTHSFLRAMIPLPRQFDCVLIGRDIYYVEDLAPVAAPADRVPISA